MKKRIVVAITCMGISLLLFVITICYVLMLDVYENDASRYYVEELRLQLGTFQNDLTLRETRHLYNCLVYNTYIRKYKYEHSCIYAQRVSNFRRAVRRYTRERGPWYAEQWTRFRDVWAYGDPNGPLFQILFAEKSFKHGVIGVVNEDNNSGDKEGRYDTMDTSHEICNSIIESAYRTNRNYNRLLSLPKKTKNEKSPDLCPIYTFTY